MAITIDWANKIINVPQADMLLVQSAPTEIRELDLDAFRLELRSLEASEEGMPFLPTHTHVAPITVGGVTLARVIEIINGYTVTFEDNQYAVNLSGANSNVADVTNVNQVSVRSANSAGLTYSKQVEDQSFEGAMVWINNVTGSAGTQFPLGTPGHPVSNFSDADTIKGARGLPSRFKIFGNYTLDSSIEFSSHTVISDSASNSKLTFVGNDTTNAVFESLAIEGTLNGVASFDNCRFDGTVSNFVGRIVNSGFNGTIVLGSGTAHNFINCHSHIGGIQTPTLDCNNLPNLNISIRGYTGGLQIINFSGSNSAMSIDLLSGHAILDSSVTAPDLVIRGTGYVTNNSSVTPNTSGLAADKVTLEIVRKFLTNRMETNPSTGVLTLYDDDDVTVLYSGNIYEDVLATQLYRSQGLERRNKLT